MVGYKIIDSKEPVKGSWKGGDSSSGYQSKWGNWTGSSYSTCTKHTWEPVFSFDGIDYFGSAKSDIPSMKADDPKRLIVNATGYSSNSSTNVIVKDCPKDMLELKDDKYIIKFKKADELLLDWDDGQPLRAKASFWPDLHSRAKLAGYKQVIGCCVGGHGRTGTFLSCMLLALGLETDPDSAIGFVRKQHCKKAVETFSQIDYIEAVARLLANWKPISTDGHCGMKPSK